MNRIAKWIIERSKATPYFPIMSPDGTEMYMDRHWLFNAYTANPDGQGGTRPRFSWLPSARVHHILRHDHDRHLHDHPWDAMTVILHGWYKEEREDGVVRLRKAGDIVRIRHSDFHRIVEVSPGGVHTLFITGRWRHVWGYKTPWREYLAANGDTANLELAAKAGKVPDGDSPAKSGGIADISDEEWRAMLQAAGRRARKNSCDMSEYMPNVAHGEGLEDWVLGWKLQDEAFRSEKLAKQRASGKHVCYKTGEADAPDEILDRNRHVVLDLCRNCGRGEAELLDHPVCDFRKVDDASKKVSPLKAMNES